MSKPSSILIVVFTLILYSCEKESRIKEKLLGTWVSVNHVDTLTFVDYEIFEKNFDDGRMHSYLYELKADSIEIQYKGYYLIGVLPSTHHFNIENNTFSIDFSNGCYGFESSLEVFKRLE